MASDGSPTPATIVAEEKRVSPTAALINMSTYISEIEGEGLAIGGIFALNKPAILKRGGYTHIVTAVRLKPAIRAAIKPEYTEELAEFKRLIIEVDDIESENVLVYFPQAYKFISEGLAAGGKIFIHCAVGVSRSASILASFLMKKYRLSPGEALERIREYRPQVEPNSGFMEQLELWQKMDYAEDVEDHPVYQRWIYKREVEESIAQGMAPTRIHFRDQEKEISKIASGSTDSRTGNANIELRCKKCRRTVATSKDLIPHEPKKIINDQDPAFREVGKPVPCSHYFVEPLTWMEAELSQGNLSGKLECPKCKCKLGSYAWQGTMCSCGEWIVPGISVARGRVDEAKVIAR